MVKRRFHHKVMFHERGERECFWKHNVSIIIRRGNMILVAPLMAAAKREVTFYDFLLLERQALQVSLLA
jgi:hypothetical protein